jgi:hypothetical protein
MQEKTLVAHMCERKRRALQKDEKRVQAGYMAFNRFWQLTQNAKVLKSYDNFADSSYYKDRKSTRLNSSHFVGRK